VKDPGRQESAVKGPWARLGKNLRRDLLVALALILVLEGLAQVFPPSDGTAPMASTAQSGEILMHGNPYLIWELIPGEWPARGGKIRTNSMGFRDDAVSPKSLPRIWLTGDSAIYGFGVDQEKVLSEQLEAIMTVDVLNGGVPGYTSEQVRNQILMHLNKVDPDVVVVATLLSDGHFDSFIDRQRLVRMSSWEEGLLGRIVSGSGLVKWVKRGWATASGGGPQSIDWKQAQSGTGMRRVPIDEYAENLADICTILARQDRGLVFLELARSEDLMTEWKRRNHEYTTAEGLEKVAPWDPYREVMGRTADRCSAPLLRAREVFWSSSPPIDRLLLDEMHLSPDGHQVLARALGEMLVSLGWPEKPLRVRSPGNPVDSVQDPFQGRGKELGLLRVEAGPSVIR
jgi:lysophospholipase L1-like esterase